MGWCFVAAGGAPYIASRGGGPDGARGEVAGEEAVAGGRRRRWRRRCGSQAVLSTEISGLWIGTGWRGTGAGQRGVRPRRRDGGHSVDGVAGGASRSGRADSWTTENSRLWIGSTARGSSAGTGEGRGPAAVTVGAARRHAADGAQGRGGNVWLGGVRGNGGEAGDARGAEGEATGGDHKGAAPSGTAMPMSWPCRHRHQDDFLNLGL